MKKNTPYGTQRPPLDPCGPEENFQCLYDRSLNQHSKTFQTRLRDLNTMLSESIGLRRGPSIVRVVALFAWRRSHTRRVCDRPKVMGHPHGWFSLSLDQIFDRATFLGNNP